MSGKLSLKLYTDETPLRIQSTNLLSLLPDYGMPISWYTFCTCECNGLFLSVQLEVYFDKTPSINHFKDCSNFVGGVKH